MTEGPAHFAVVTSSRAYRVVLEPDGLITRTELDGLHYGWECVLCFRAEAAHYSEYEQAEAAADRHAEPLTVDAAQLQEAHCAVVVRSTAYTIVDLEGQPPVPGLGYGWECLLCDRAEAATYTTEEEARSAADRHQRARIGDLLTLNQFLDKIDAIPKDVFGVLDPGTREVRAFVFKATPTIHEVVQRLTGEVPPPPHGHNLN